MGNWRTVHLQGSVGTPEWYPLVAHLSVRYEDPAWGCLHSGGLFGLQNWAQSNVKERGDRVEFSSYGNLGERDYTPGDVADEIRRIKDQVAPSLILRVDCGGEYEDLTCVATVLVGEDDIVVVVPPMVEVLPEELSPSSDEVGMRMLAELHRQGAIGWHLG
jgi:hypothetical protein